MSLGLNELSVWFKIFKSVYNQLNMILGKEEPMVYLFSDLKIHLASWKVSKISSCWVFFNSYYTSVNVTYIANWGPNPEATLIP